MSEQNKMIGRKFFQEQDRLKGGPADELCAPTYRASVGSSPTMDLAGHKQFAKAFYAGFPDLKHTVDDAIAEGDKVVVRFTVTGTHTGDFMGIPATRKPFKATAIGIFRIANGKVTDLRGEFDQMGMMQQLGVIPAPK